MRVIGTKPEGEVEIVCTGCYWRLAYTRADIRLNNDPDEPSSEHYHYITCPKCQKIIKLAKPAETSRDDEY